MQSRWILLSALALSNLIEQFDRYLFSVARLPFIDDKSYEYALLAGTLFSVVYCMGNVCFALLMRVYKFDRVVVVAFSCLLSSLALFVVPFCKSFALQAILRLSMGFAQSPISAFSSSLIKDIFEDDLRGSAFGIFDSGTFLGFAICLTVGTILNDEYGWQIPYHFMGLFGILYAISLYFFLIDPYRNGATCEYEGEVSLQYLLGDKDLQPLHHNDNDRIISSDSDVSSDKSKETYNLIWAYNELSSVVLYAVEYPSILLILLACGIRFSGGYMYAYYISIFFSDLYEKLESNGNDVSCTYSYDTSSQNQYADSCTDLEYPYCVDNVCQKLSSSPWHNKGMDHSNFEKYFAGMVVIGSVSSCILGGWIGDYLSQNSKFGVASRLLVSGFSLLLAAPCYYALYTLEYPACFGILALGGFFGEMYFGLCLAVLAEMIPWRMFTTGMAIFISILILFGCNGTLFVPLLRNAFNEDDSIHHTFNLEVAPTYSEYVHNNSSMNNVNVEQREEGGTGLRLSLSWLVPGTYIVAGLIFIGSFDAVRNDVERIRIKYTSSLKH